VKRPTPHPFHPPVGTSDEAYPSSRKWFAVGMSALILLLAALAVALRP
jgi:hypothetical protein